MGPATSTRPVRTAWGVVDLFGEREWALAEYDALSDALEGPERARCLANRNSRVDPKHY